VREFYHLWGCSSEGVVIVRGVVAWELLQLGV
jgi:hypothetical protein